MGKYTTIQISKEFNTAIQSYCREHKINASRTTEYLWNNFISSSDFLENILIMNPQITAMELTNLFHAYASQSFNNGETE